MGNFAICQKVGKEGYFKISKVEKERKMITYAYESYVLSF